MCLLNENLCLLIYFLSENFSSSYGMRIFSFFSIRVCVSWMNAGTLTGWRGGYRVAAQFRIKVLSCFCFHIHSNLNISIHAWFLFSSTVVKLKHRLPSTQQVGGNGHLNLQETFKEIHETYYMQEEFVYSIFCYDKFDISFHMVQNGKNHNTNIVLNHYILDIL